MKKRHTIKGQLVAVFIGLITLSLVLITIINWFFLERYYVSHKENMISSAYQQINSMEDVTENFSSTIMQSSAKNNLNILITDSNFQILNSTSRDAKDLCMRLFGYYTGLYREDKEVLESTDTYNLQKSSDRMVNLEYLEMWGVLDNGNLFIIRTPMESIRESVQLSTIFYIVVGFFVLILSSMIIWLFAKRFTKPITTLTEISRRMTDLDFDAKYTDSSANEIDVLGENFNLMSKELEQTISELKSANVELEKDIQQKIQVDEMRKDFLNNVSHELKTPIALIQGYSEGLKDNINEDQDSRDFYCDVIIDEARKMNQLVKKLTTLNELEFGQDQVTMERFDLTTLIRGILQSSEILIKQKEANILFEQTEPVYVWGDEFKIEEVVTNYLTNALNHLDYDRKIEIRMQQENGVVRTSVFNTGDPIPEEDMENIWIKFYKVDKARTREYGGSGIGLSIVKAIMDSMNQRCGAVNYHNGVEFWFTLESK